MREMESDALADLVRSQSREESEWAQKPTGHVDIRCEQQQQRQREWAMQAGGRRFVAMWVGGYLEMAGDIIEVGVAPVHPWAPQGNLLLSLEKMSDWTGWMALGGAAESRMDANMGVAWRCPRVSLREREGGRGREGESGRMTPNERERRAFARRSRQGVVRWRMGCRRWYQKKPDGVKKGPIRYCSPGVLVICKDVRGG